MKQQINLYQPVFRRQKVIFSARTLAWTSAGFALLLLLWTALMAHQVRSLEQEQQRQLARERQTTTQLGNMRRELPGHEPGAELEIRIEREQQRRDRLRQSMAAIESRLPSRQVNLRARLEAIACRRPQGLWLTAIEVADNGRQLRLEGRALAPRLVPAMLTALAREPVIAGLTFRQLRVSAADDSLPGVTFSLATHRDEQP